MVNAAHACRCHESWLLFGQSSLCARHLSHKVVHKEFNFVRILRVSNSPWVSLEGVCYHYLLPWFVADYKGELQKSDGIELVLGPMVSC